MKFFIIKALMERNLMKSTFNINHFVPSNKRIYFL